MYYSKFYCKLDYSKFFQYNRKSWTYYYYKYILNSLKKYVFQVLNQVKFFKILEYYKNCLKKLDLYREKVVYSTNKQKKLIFHKKAQDINNDSQFLIIRFYIF